MLFVQDKKNEQPQKVIRKIIHIDMDCFYAQVEERDNPYLQGKPVAVGGNKEQRGVIATCNYSARQYGVHSAMSTAYALKLCPNLILVSGRMDVYKAISLQIRDIFARYTSLIEPLSLDEAYLDVSDCVLYKGSATLIAKAIRQDILKETGLTASAGIAPIKFLAKIASDLNKPNGQFVIPPENVTEFIRTLPLKKIPGVGKVTAEKLLALGFEHCADIQQAPKALILKKFGKFGQVLIERCHGIDLREVMPNRVRKSVGVEITLDKDISAFSEVKKVLADLLPELVGRIEKGAKSRQIHKQVVKLKFSDFVQTTTEMRSDRISISLFYHLLQQAFARADGKGIRLVGISVGLKQPEEKLSTVYMQQQLELNFDSVF